MSISTKLEVPTALDSAWHGSGSDGLVRAGLDTTDLELMFGVESQPLRLVRPPYFSTKMLI